jgi:hypothetical protein
MPENRMSLIYSAKLDSTPLIPDHKEGYLNKKNRKFSRKKYVYVSKENGKRNRTNLLLFLC